MPFHSVDCAEDNVTKFNFKAHTFFHTEANRIMSKNELIGLHLKSCRVTKTHYRYFYRVFNII